MVKAYQYTNMVSVFLLSCLTTPFVMILSRIVLKTRYGIWHVVALLVALAGVFVLVFTEVYGSSTGTTGHSTDNRPTVYE